MASSSASSSHSNTSPPPQQPQSLQPQTISAPLRRLLDETADLIDSPSFTHVLTRLLDASFSHLIDIKLSSQAFSPKMSSSLTSDPAAGPRIQELPDPSTVRTKLATVLAVMTRQAHTIGHGVPNEYLQAMEQVRELEAFAAVVYSSNFDFEKEPVGEPVPRATGVSGEVDEGSDNGPVTGDAGTGGDMDASGEMVGAGSGFESAWGRAVATAVEATEGERTFSAGVDAASSAS